MARIASSDWLTSRGASWLCSNTSPATTTNSAPTSAASGAEGGHRVATGGRIPRLRLAVEEVTGSCRVASRRCARNRISTRPFRRVGVAGQRECRAGRRQLRGRAPACPTVIRMTAPLARGTDRTLLLLRHAKSDYPAGVADHDRPLAPRGMREAALAGDWLRAHAPAVDAVLCSTADPDPRDAGAHPDRRAGRRYVDRLYDATPGAVIDEINGVGRDVDVRRDAAGDRPRAGDVVAGARPGDRRRAATALRPNESRRSSRRRRSRCCAPRAVGRDLALGGAALVTFHVPRRERRRQRWWPASAPSA